MTPATAAAPRAKRRSAAGSVGHRSGAGRRPPPKPRAARRVSGPAGGLRGLAGARVAGASAAPALAPPLPLRLAAAGVQGLVTLPDRGIVLRLVRGRFWIAVIACALLGIVAMQVTMLKLNAGISRSVDRVAALQRDNEVLSATIAAKTSVTSIQLAGTRLGLVMPPPGEFRYLTSDPQHDVANALREMTSPQPPLEPMSASVSVGTNGSATSASQSAGGSVQGAAGSAQSAGQG
jgi:hypothetical protein